MNYSNKEIPFAPIIRPTVEEFSDFRSYMFNLFQNSDFQNAGCIKVILKDYSSHTSSRKQSIHLDIYSIKPSKISNSIAIIWWEKCILIAIDIQKIHVHLRLSETRKVVWKINWKKEYIISWKIFLGKYYESISFIWSRCSWIFI